MQAPTANEGIATARAVVNELDAARFDPLLAKAVAKGASRAVETYISRAEGLVRLSVFPIFPFRPLTFSIAPTGRSRPLCDLPPRPARNAVSATKRRFDQLAVSPLATARSCVE
jgi:hypothetical protein